MRADTYVTALWLADLKDINRLLLASLKMQAKNVC